MMKVFQVCNTSSCWWVIAPDEEIAIRYSFRHTSTREERNLYISNYLEPYYLGKKIQWSEEKIYDCQTLNTLLESNRVGIIVRIEVGELREYKWKFTCSHKWTPEEYI
jgi:hypothetical protein